MTIPTDDTWIATLDDCTNHTRAFQVGYHEARDRLPSRGSLTTCNEASCSIVFSGVLYNRRDLDAEMPQSGSNDAARVLHSYLRDGGTCFGALRGIFALVLWDPRSDTLLAVRDRLGILPLFYAKDSQGRWLFSPALGRLVDEPTVSRQLDRAVIAERLCDQWINGEETEYAAVRRVLPGHVLTVRRNGVHASRYWNPPPANLRIRDAGEILDRFENAFGRAVAHTYEHGKTGIFLSGGVDSISVASVAAELATSAHKSPPIALSLLYADPELHETHIQHAVATSLGLPTRQITLQEAIGDRPATESLLDANAEWPVPIFNIWQPAFLQLAREGRALGCEVILTGGGGDEWLGVSPYLAADLIGDFRIIDLYRFCRRTVRSYDIGYRGLLRTCGWTFGIKPHLARVRDRAAALVNYDVDRRSSARRIPRWIAPTPALRDAITERCAIAWRADRLGRAAAPSYYDYEARRTLDHPIVVGEVENKFHCGQRAGVRMLEPYWDADLVELLYTTHPDALSFGGFSKGLVHRLVHRALPDLPLIRQRKIALSMAYQERVRREGAQAWAKMKGLPALAQMGVVDAEEVGKKVRSVLAEANNNGAWLIPYLLSVEAWVRAHG